MFRVVVACVFARFAFHFHDHATNFLFCFVFIDWWRYTIWIVSRHTFTHLDIRIRTLQIRLYVVCGLYNRKSYHSNERHMKNQNIFLYSIYKCVQHIRWQKRNSKERFKRNNFFFGKIRANFSHHDFKTDRFGCSLLSHSSKFKVLYKKHMIHINLECLLCCFVLYLGFTDKVASGRQWVRETYGTQSR